MSKPEDIPQDVWDTAVSVAQEWEEDTGSLVEWYIARAMMSAAAKEREACAAHAVETTKAPAQRNTKDQWVEQIGQSVASAIRKRDTP
ncbi:MAG TPA: hypothetical protein VN155_16785 [Devosia sp.]|nr:hypothetical protein [Devosia sp.]